MTSELACLRVTVPVDATELVRAQLQPYLIHATPWSRIASGNGKSMLLLHPRLALDDLPESVRSGVEAHGVDWETHSLTLSEADRTQLFTVVFFSKSKVSPALAKDLPNTWRRVLSNFHQAELCIDERRYASVEHFFQSQKALCSTKPEMAQRFCSDDEHAEAVGSDPADAKRAGSRKSYAIQGAILDQAAWLDARVGAMERALEARWKQQSVFRAVLSSTKGLELLHFERSGTRSFWGGSISKDTGLPQGRNQLGRMLMQLRDQSC